LKKKKTPLYVPILWVFVTGTWIVTVSFRISIGDTQGFLFVMQCATVFVSGAAAVANFIRYKRSKNKEDEKE
jgi:hypothetical protein